MDELPSNNKSIQNQIYNKKFYLKNKDNKQKCECGRMILYFNQSRHRKTQVHKRFLLENYIYTNEKN